MGLFRKEKRKIESGETYIVYWKAGPGNLTPCSLFLNLFIRFPAPCRAFSALNSSRRDREGLPFTTVFTFHLTGTSCFTIFIDEGCREVNRNFLWSWIAMKIKVERDKIVQAVKKMEGIELVINDADDAREALDLILRRTELLGGNHYQILKDLTVTTLQEYKTSAVDYTIQFVLEFIFADDVTLDRKAGFIKDLQGFFNKL
jgi:hypothetical protein